MIIRPPSREKRPSRSAARETRVFSGRLARPVRCSPVRLPCAVIRGSVIPLFFNLRSGRARLISIWAVGQRALESNPLLSSRTLDQVREIDFFKTQVRAEDCTAPVAQGTPSASAASGGSSAGPTSGASRSSTPAVTGSTASSATEAAQTTGAAGRAAGQPLTGVFGLVAIVFGML